MAIWLEDRRLVIGSAVKRYQGLRRGVHKSWVGGVYLMGRTRQIAYI